MSLGFGWPLLGAFLCIFLLLIWSGRNGFRKEYRDNATGLADLLRYYKPVRDGVILGKGGELMAGFSFRGIDPASSTNGDVMGVMGRLNDMLRKFGTGWMVHADASRHDVVGYPEGIENFPNPVMRLMEEERREQYTAEGTHFDSRYTVVLSWVPPLTAAMKAASFLFEHSEERENEVEDLGAIVLKQFEAVIGEVERTMGVMFNDVKRLRRGPVQTEITGAEYVVDHLVSYLGYCVTGVANPIRYSLNSELSLDALLAKDFVGGVTPKVGDLHIRTVVIEGFPSEAPPTILGMLNALPVRYRWSTRLIFMDAQTGLAVVDKLKRFWGQNVRPMMDVVLNRQGALDQNASDMEADAEGAKKEINAGWVRQGHYTSVVVLMDKDADLLDGLATAIAEDISALQFPARVEKENAVEAYLGSLPGHGKENVRRPTMNTMNMAYLFPSTALWLGVKKHPCKFYPPDSPPLLVADSAGATPCRVVVHHEDVGHFFGIGGTGGGKSTLLQTLVKSQFRYPNARVNVFEKGYSGYVMCKAARGNHYDIGGEEDKSVFAPLADVDQPKVRVWAEDYVCMLLALQNHAVTPKNRIVIRAALKRVGTDEDRDLRTMTQLVNYLQDDTLRQVLSFYTVAGANPYLDGKASQENIKLGRYNVFEIGNLMAMGEQHTVPILFYLLHKVERSQNFEPTLFILDEAALAFKMPMVLEYFEKWLLTMRKENVGVGFFTNDLVGLMNSPLLGVILLSCPTQFYLANHLASSTFSKLYSDLGLNDGQKKIITSAEPKRDYYYVSPYGSRKISLSLGPMCMAFVGATAKEDVEQAKHLEKVLGDRWVVEWVRQRAGDRWAQRLSDEMDREQRQEARQAA